MTKLKAKGESMNIQPCYICKITHFCFTEFVKLSS